LAGKYKRKGPFGNPGAAVSSAIPIAPAVQTARVTALPEKLPLGQGARHKDCGRVLIDECGEVLVEFAVAQLIEALRYKPEGREFNSPLGFFINIILPAELWSWVRYSL